MKHCSSRPSEALSVSVCEHVICVCVCVVSERLHQHREQQRQVFGSADGQFVRGVVMNDFRDGVKRRTVLSQDELPITRLRELHVHEPVTAPERQRIVVSARLALPHQITALLTQQEQSFSF